MWGTCLESFGADVSVALLAVKSVGEKDAWTGSNWVVEKAGEMGVMKAGGMGECLAVQTVDALVGGMAWSLAVQKDIDWASLTVASTAALLVVKKDEIAVV